MYAIGDIVEIINESPNSWLNERGFNPFYFGTKAKIIDVINTGGRDNNSPDFIYSIEATNSQFGVTRTYVTRVNIKKSSRYKYNLPAWW